MKWFFNLKTRSKILTGFLIMIILMVIVGCIGALNIQKINTLDTELYENNTKPISLMNIIQVDLQKNRVLSRDIIIGNGVNKNNDSKNTILANDKEIDKAMEEFKRTIQDQELIDEYNNLRSNIDKYRPVRDKVIDLGTQNKTDEAISIMNGEASILAKGLDDSAIKLISLKEAHGKDKSDTNSKTAKTSIITMFGIIFMGIIIALVLGFIIAGLISKPINRVLYMFEEMSKGHLGERVNINTKDEVGQMAKVMDSFADVLQNVVIGTMNKIAKGDIGIDIDVIDEKDEISPALKKVIENVRRLVTDANMLSNAAIEGKFETRADASKHDGDFKKVIEGVNGTLDTVADKAAWYEAIIDAIPLPIHVIDNDMKWTYMNKPFENLMINQGVIRDRKSGYGLACSNAGASICNTDNCGIKQLHKGKAESFFEWCGMNNKQDSAHLKNKKGENIGYVEVVTDLTPIIRVSNYTKTEVKRLEGNLKLLSNGNTNFDLKVKEADKYTSEVNEQFEGISNSLKDVKNAVDNLVTNANMISNAATEGNLDMRTDAAKHSGDFKKVVDGINELMEAMGKPIKEVISCMSEIAEGNLQFSVNENYKGQFGVLASSVNTTINSLNSVLGELNTASEQVLTGSNQVSDGSQALSQGATQQASAIEELNASINEVSGQTKENASNANQAKEFALKVKENAEEGNRHMGEMLKSMSNINESSANISKIIKVIDEIAFQTNILALNAAVEAARAGQHGKGFAVVAEEVRNLAARSANAAKETTDLIEGSIKKIEKGTDITNDTAKALEEIVEGVSKVTGLVAEIAALSNEQASSISQISLGVEQVSQVVQANSSTAEQSAAASEELSSQAELLKDMVSSFKLKNSNMKNRLLDDNYEKKHNYHTKINMVAKEVAASASSKIALSDRAFGKY